MTRFVVVPPHPVYGKAARRHREMARMYSERAEAAYAAGALAAGDRWLDFEEAHHRVADQLLIEAAWGRRENQAKKQRRRDRAARRSNHAAG